MRRIFTLLVLLVTIQPLILAKNSVHFVNNPSVFGKIRSQSEQTLLSLTNVVPVDLNGNPLGYFYGNGFVIVRNDGKPFKLIRGEGNIVNQLDFSETSQWLKDNSENNYGGWLDGWNYKAIIDIQERAGKDLIDYPVKIVLDSSWDGWSYVKQDGGDIRFTLDDGVTKIPYWIEEWDYTDKKAIIWVKVPSIPKNSQVRIYMYYGNPSTQSESNGSNVFTFFDDFESYPDNTNIDGQGGWKTVYVGGNGEAKIVTINGRKYLHLSSTYKTTTVMRTMTLSSNYAIRLREFADDWDQAILIDFTPDGKYSNPIRPDNGYHFVFWGWKSSPPLLYGVAVVKSGSESPLTNGVEASDSNYVNHTIEAEWFGNRLVQLVDDNVVNDVTDNTYSSVNYWSIGEFDGSSRYIDWVLVRKIVLPEPSVSVESSVSRTNSGWSHRDLLLVTEHSGNNLIDYPVKIVLDPSWDGWSYVKSDGSDIRFTLSDGVTKIPYWIEEWDYSNKKAIIWVKIPQIPKYSTIKIYMYYDNPNALPESDGSKVFTLFDDFDSVSDWKSPGLNVQYDTSNSIVKITMKDNSNQEFFKQVNMGSSCAIRTKMSVPKTGGYTDINLGMFSVEPNKDYHPYVIGSGYHEQVGTFSLSYEYNSSGSTIDNYKYGLSWGSVHTYELMYYKNIVISTLDGNIMGSGRIPVTFDCKYTGLYLDLDSGDELNVDWILVRKYVYPEPTVMFVKDNNLRIETTLVEPFTFVFNTYINSDDPSIEVKLLDNNGNGYVITSRSGLLKLGKYSSGSLSDLDSNNVTLKRGLYTYLIVFDNGLSSVIYPSNVEVTSSDNTYNKLYTISIIGGGFNISNFRLFDGVITPLNTKHMVVII